MKEKNTSASNELTWEHSPERVLTPCEASKVRLVHDDELNRRIRDAQKIHDDLRLVQARHANKPTYTGNVSISDMAKDSADTIHELITLVMFLARPTFELEVELPRRWTR